MAERDDGIAIPLKKIESSDSIELQFREGGDLDLKLSPKDKPWLYIPLITKIYKKKLHLSFKRLENIKQITVLPVFSATPSIEADVIPIPTGRAGGLRLDYNILLPDGDYDALRIAFLGWKRNGRAVLSGVSLDPVSIGDSTIWVNALTIGVAAYILLPGILLLSLFHRQVEDRASFSCLALVYSVVFYMAGYGIWLICTRLQVKQADLILLGCVMAGLAGFGFFNFYLDRGITLSNFLRTFRIDMLIYVIVLMAISFLITRGSNLPIENTWYTTIAGPKTYRAFRAHDAVFQYVNGFAISNDEPFKKYYRNRRLVYGVEDREILPGTLYAVLRSTLRNVSSRIADSFLVYTIFGTGLNLLILFPVLAFCRRFVGTLNTPLFVLAFSLNAFVMVNYYLTWFKMAGGAFFLCGLYVLMQARRNYQWGVSGLLFGIGANMHAGSALGIPFFFVWSVMRRLRDASGERFKALLAPCALVIVFIGVNLPWATVKHYYLRDSHALLSQHFLSGASHPEGLLKSVELFFQKEPLSKQIKTRFERFRKSFRLSEVKDLIATLKNQSLFGFFFLWNQYEFRFVAFSFYPLLFLLSFMFVLDRVNTRIFKNPSKAGGAVSPQMVIFLIGVSALTIGSIILLSYGSHKPDLNYHLPMGVTLLAYSLLLGSIFNYKGFICLIPIAYYAFSAYRLFSVY